MNSYYFGQAVTLAVTFADASTELPGDPTTVTLRVEDPIDVETTYTGVALSHPATGVYQKVITVELAGIWRYRWEAAGAIVTSVEQCFEVRPSSFEP